MHGFVCKKTGRPEAVSLSLSCLRCSFVLAMLTDYGMMRGKEQTESGKFSLIDTVGYLIKICAESDEKTR